MITKALRWTALGALFIIPVLPLFVANTLFFPFITGKGFAFRILVEIAVCAWAALAVIDPKYRPRFSWTFVVFGVLVIWMALADALAVNPHKAFWSNFERMDGWITLIHLFGFFLVASSLLAVDKLWRRWWLTFVTVAGVVCVYSVFQLTGLLAIHQGGVRVDATFGNAAYLAAYLLFALAITLWQAIESKGWLRYVLFVLAILEIVILFFTATRGAILGMVGGAALGALLWMFESGKKSRRAAGGVLFALLVLVGGFFLVKDSHWVRSDPTLARIASISLSQGETRFTLWHMALEGAAARPITGWGQEGFNYVFNTYYDPSLYGQEAWFDRAHDIFLDWLIAGGIPALLLFLALLISAVLPLYRSGASRPERIVFVCALAAYAFQGLFVFDNLFTYVPLVAIFACAHALSNRPIRALEKIPAGRSDTAQGIASGVAVVAAIALIWTVNVPSVRAANDLVYALSSTSSTDISGNIARFQSALADGSFATQEVREQLLTFAEGVVSAQSIPTSQKNQVFQLALSEMGKEIALAPRDARLHLEYALGFRAAGDYADAQKESAISAQLSPNKQSIILEQGLEALQEGSTTAASAFFKKAAEVDPSFTELAVYNAAGHIVTGDVAGGKALLQQAYGTTTVDNQVLLIAYYEVKDYPDLIAAWRQRVIVQNGSVSSRFGLAAAYATAGRFSDARTEIEATIAAHPEAATEGTAFLSSLPK